MKPAPMITAGTLFLCLAAVAVAQPNGRPLPTPLVKPPLRPAPTRPDLVPIRPPLRPPILACGVQFADPCAQAEGHARARIGWSASTQSGLTHYQVLRGTGGPPSQLVATLPASVREWVDDGLAPDMLANYRVRAVKMKPADAEPDGRVFRPSQGMQEPRFGVTPRLPVVTELESSAVVSVATPALPALNDIRLDVLAISPGRVRLSWQPTGAGLGVELLRGGRSVQLSPVAATSLVDAQLPDGNHAYRLRTYLVTRDGRRFTGPESSELMVRLTPFRMLSFGDSVMWGQGVAERSRFTTLVANSLQSRLPVLVQQHGFAHSGASLRQPADQPLPAGYNEALLATHGEVPNRYPGIPFQYRVQGPQALAAAGARREDVDLVLINGCANDIGIMNVIKPSVTPEQLAAMTHERCGSWMEATLDEVAALYPHARIVVTGYYQAFSESTDRTALGPLFGGLAAGSQPEVVAGAVAGWAAGPIVGLVTSVALTEQAGIRAIENSARFKLESDAALRRAVDALNSRQPGRARFAASGFGTENAYASRSGPTWLWLVPAGLLPGDLDPMHGLRATVCNTPGVVETSLGAPLRGAPDAFAVESSRVTCQLASAAHPNTLGAASYARSVLEVVEPFVQGWQQLYSRTRAVSR